MVKVTGTTLVRDTNSMGLSNVDPKEKQEYYDKVRMINLQKEDLNKVRAEIDEVKSDVSEIKEMLSKILEKL